MTDVKKKMTLIDLSLENLAFLEERRPGWNTGPQKWRYTPADSDCPEYTHYLVVEATNVFEWHMGEYLDGGVLRELRSRTGSEEVEITLKLSQREMIESVDDTHKQRELTMADENDERQTP